MHLTFQYLMRNEMLERIRRNVRCNGQQRKMPFIANGTIRFLDEESEGVIGYVRELEGTKLVVLCNLCEEENKVVWQSEWDSYELLLGNYSDGKVDGTLRPYECKVMPSI